MERLHPSPAVAGRITRLRETMLGPREVSIERNVLMAESYGETVGQPACLRRARSLAHILEHMSLYIGPDELLVGRLTDRPRACCYAFEEMFNDLQQSGVNGMPGCGDGMVPIPSAYGETIGRLGEAWRAHPVNGGVPSKLPRRYIEMANTFYGAGAGAGHHSIDYTLLLDRGALGLIDDIDRELAACPEASEEKKNNLAASRIALQALMTIAARYAGYAQTLAETETDPVRRVELEEIAAVCRRVPAHPAACFHEAVQAVWFTNLALLHEDWSVGIGFMRPDQYLLPYYRRDLDRGVLTRERAYLLLAMLLIKTNEELPTGLNVVMSINLTLGGVDAAGNCAVNELSWLFLDAEQDVALSDEDIILRVADNTPEAFLERACAVAKRLNGKMKFVGDDLILRQLQRDGRPLELARNYCITGCNSATIPGYSYDMPGELINLPFLLDLALHDGYSTVLGRQVGLHSGDARRFTRYEQLWEAFAAQCRDVLPFVRQCDNLVRAERSAYTPNPLQSALCHGYVQKGVDVKQGGLAPLISLGISLSGAPNVGDALAAVKTLVFERGELSMAELIAALDRDFADDEALLARIAAVPKFGNNIASVDAIVNDVLTLGSDILAAEPCIWDAHPVCAAGVISCNVLLGRCVGALPDGRRRGLPISEGGISPYQGRNTCGPTATLLSVAGLDHMKLRHGSVLNLRFDPKALEGEEKLRRFAQMIRAYFKAGGFLVQFNIVTTETLLAAQREPEKYRDLVVRVATYAAYFVDLEKDLQDDIIGRTLMS